MGPLGVPELIIIFVIALLVFGPRRLPELGRTLGKAMTEFRRASNELKAVVEDEVREMERQTADVKRSAEDAIRSADADVTDAPDDMHTSSATPTGAPPGTNPASPAQFDENEKPAHGQPGTV